MPDEPSLLVPAGADDLCLGFANTRYWRGSAKPTETLAGFADLLRWLEGQAALPTALAVSPDDGPERAATIFVEAIALRETLYRALSAVAAGEPVAHDDLGALNRALAQAPRRCNLVRGPTGFGWQIAAAYPPSAQLLLAPVIWSAADLLTQTGRRRIRRCANDQCLWLFVDNSKSGTRRWCDMAACGNRAKAHRHYLKIKGA